jgi:hypothetical protein
MNQLDWEKMREDINLTNVTRVTNSSWYATQSEYAINVGSHISGNYTDTQAIDSRYERFSEVKTTASYYPSGYSLLGSTTYVSGSLTDLQSDNGVYMTFRSYPSSSSAQTLYAHQETSTIGGSSYYQQKLTSADTTGTTLSASMATTGRQLFGKFVYPLTGVSSIPASTWTMYNRAWKDSDQPIAYDNANSTTLSTAGTSMSWRHTTGSGNNRFLIVAVSVQASTGAPTTVTNVTYGGTLMTQETTDIYSSTTPQVREYTFSLKNPASGRNTIMAKFLASTTAVGGSVSYTGVDQTTPIQTRATNKGSGWSESASVTVSGSNRWVFGHVACYMTYGFYYTITDGSGQNHRWGQNSQLYEGDADDKSNVSPGSVSMSWSTFPWTVSWVASALAINPASPVGTVDSDILIRKSDNTVRTTIATAVAGSGALTTSATTLSGTYSWSAYTVVSQTDYLEIDYYADVTSSDQAMNAYLRIDDNTLAPAYQTSATNINLPSAYTSEVEFTGSSNNRTWNQLVWTINSAWTTGSVLVTIQVYNYTLGGYSTSGAGYNSYTSNSTANTDETRTQTITQNPTQFRNATGYWKIKVKGVKTTTTSFDFKADFILFQPVINYQLDLNGTYTIDLSTYPLAYIKTIEIRLRYRANDTGDIWYLKAYNWTSRGYSDNGFNTTAGYTPTTNWDNYAVNLTSSWRSYVASNGTMYVKFVDTRPGPSCTTIDIDFLGIRAIINGANFTFKNEGSLTLHVVSLWVINSTNHRQYDADAFINSAETFSYFRVDIPLPSGQYTAKVVTERGNVAVYFGS